MGKDGSSALDLPLSLKVKNTFIDLNREEDSEGEDATFLQASFRQRQVSEPVPIIHRQLSSGPTYYQARSPVASGHPQGVQEEEEELEDSDEREEPETEKDPCWVLDRQLSQEDWPHSLGRQVTEQVWPSWSSTGEQPMLVRTQTQEQWQEPAVAPAEPAWQEPPPRETTMVPAEWAGTSTVMMRNLPNKYTQHMLLNELNQSGFLGTFDFMYLPIDPETNANRGYAFVNFTDPSFAWMLRSTYQGRKMSRFNSDKVVTVVPAALQGFEANYAHYSQARVNRGDPAARPLFLRESSLRHLTPKHEGGRRRGGRRSSGSLIDMAAKQQQQKQAAMTAGLADGCQFEDRKAAAEQLGAPKFCPFCGGRVLPQFRFCQYCGASLGLTL